MMMEFQELRQRMMADCREAVERRYFALTGELPPEEVVENMIAEGKSEEVLNRAVVGNRSLVLETAHEIQSQHDTAKEVERSLLELQQVFLDMAVMVEAQGERMDDIEHHVTSAARYVKDGAMELSSAKAYQRGSRKWLCIAVVFLLAVVLLIVIPIATSLGKS
ncbi:hypothetical protein HPP92_001959 [Vanilla planifolia]|uniref:t-SNARE coiled-coil homology domain-containing protein n=1 Tax=Vanilla planifolia TaxID=51239 RepID=A0A835S4H3_VANPL|nr:hypothetical protein HPP92_001959 [Vanilla planifolia]